MKRKDWISVIALLIIIGFAAAGELISVHGNFALMAGNLWTFVPMIILLVFAVLMGQRKGGHTVLFKFLSWICYTLSMILLFISADSFMHFFNVHDSSMKEKLVKSTTLLKNDISNMHQAYKEGVEKRRDNYKSELRNAIELDKTKTLVAVSKKQKDWQPANAKAKEFSNAWAEKKMLPIYEDYHNSFDSISPKIDDAIVDQFNIFTAGGEFNRLQQLYDLHKINLSEKYRTLNPIEEIEGSDFELSYTDHENVWKDTHLIFEKKKFNFGWFLLFVCLAFCASLTYLCIKDESIRIPKMRKNDQNVQNVYKAGHRL